MKSETNRFFSFGVRSVKPLEVPVRCQKDPGHSCPTLTVRHAVHRTGALQMAAWAGAARASFPHSQVSSCSAQCRFVATEASPAWHNPCANCDSWGENHVNKYWWRSLMFYQRRTQGIVGTMGEMTNCLFRVKESFERDA